MTFTTFTVDQLAWIAGNWHGNADGTTGDDPAEPIIETWDAPSGGTMMGMFKWVKDGDIYLYEFLTIEAHEAEIVLFLRHFGKGSQAWEDKDTPMRWVLLGLEGQSATFENTKPGVVQRMVFTRTGNRLRVAVEVDKAGEELRITAFEYALRD